MRKVKLHFTLIGKSYEWKRNLPKSVQSEFGDIDTLSFVRDTVIGQFGDRALVIVNEKALNNKPAYPNFYSAGWFISEDENPSELVVVDHGNTMEAATKAMIESVRVIDWDSLSARI
jgi:hypothetical protein